MSSPDERFPKEFHTGPIPVQRGTGIDRIRAEQVRMTLADGTETHDESYGHDQYLAAMAYLDYVAARLGNPYTAPDRFEIPPTWPWRREEWNPAVTISENLVRAGALIAMSLDALD